MLSLVVASAALAAPIVEQVDAAPVPVLSCTEALCGGCADFLIGPLKTAVQAEGVLAIMNVTLVPFGNARIVDGKLTCQHGPDECTANSYEQCAIDAYPDFATHYPFVDCMEGHGSSMIRFASSCAKSANLDITVIEACVNDPDKSFALQQKFAGMTPSDHKYTPWVLVDDELSKSDGDKLLEEVCTAYKGTKPPGCKAVLDKKEKTCSAKW